MISRRWALSGHDGALPFLDTHSAEASGVDTLGVSFLECLDVLNCTI
jgi:hypothetical protein